MSRYSDDLRDQSATLLQGAKQMLDALAAGPDGIKSKLLNIQALPTIDAMRAALEQVIDGLDTRNDFDRLVKATACLVTGNIYVALADQSDFLMASGAMKTVVDKLRKRSSLNAAIRTAAAQGKWDEFDRLAADAISLDLSNGDVPTDPAKGSAGEGGDGAGTQAPAGANGSSVNQPVP